MQSKYCNGTLHDRYEVLPLVRPDTPLIGECRVCRGRHVYPLEAAVYFNPPSERFLRSKPNSTAIALTERQYSGVCL